MAKKVTARRVSKKIVQPKRTQSLVFVLDYSDSMTGIASTLESSYESQLATARKKAKETGIETRVSVYIFGSKVKVLFKNVDINSKSLNKIVYDNMGMTSLFDAVGQAYDDYKNTSQAITGVNDALLLIALTDGGENNSRTYKAYNIQNLLQEVNNSENASIVFIGPSSMTAVMGRYGLSADNMSTWDGSAKQLVEVEEKTSGGIDLYYTSRTRGLNKTSSFYQPNVNFSPTTLKRNVTDVTHQFLIAGVTNTWSGSQIRDFVQNELNKSYELGKAYYQLTKKETVQAKKSIVIRDLATGKMYSDDDARDLLGLPSGQEIKVLPANYTSKYELFIQSSSVNRKLVGGTKILYKVV